MYFSIKNINKEEKVYRNDIKPINSSGIIKATDYIPFDILITHKDNKMTLLAQGDLKKISILMKDIFEQAQLNKMQAQSFKTDLNLKTGEEETEIVFSKINE